MRRLSVTEIGNSIESVFGVRPDALASLPIDRLDHDFDRVVEAQTVSPVHIERFDALAEAVAFDLIDGRRLDDLTDACPDAILPPWVGSTTSVLPATGLAGDPTWALTVYDDRLYFLYSPEVTVSGTFSVPGPGTYRITMPIDVHNDEVQPLVTLTIDGEVAGVWDTAPAGASDLVADFTAADAGPALLELFFEGGSWGERGLDVYDWTIEGPVDDGATAYAAERDACAEALITELAPEAWRRPVSEAELDGLRAVYAAGKADGTDADALRMIIEVLIRSPKFLYLVEIGTPVEDTPGWYALDDHELASRLSYALCETPPDADLRAVADAGMLSDPAVLQAQARRLLDSPCGRETVSRFHAQWLHLNQLDELARDPVYYPELTPETGPAMKAETAVFLDRMIFEENADVEAIWSADHTWVDPIVADLYGVDIAGDFARIDLPPERSGLLTQPSILTVTSKFSETSPVLRGVYVLEQTLCMKLDSPPEELDVTPPELDDSLTTRERWELHSSNEQCASCHQVIDPIGFSLEEFDALGQLRTEENGLPVDSSGAIPPLDVEHVEGGRELAEHLAASDELRNCFARQWMRFGLGRLDGLGDSQMIADVATAAEDSVLEGLVELTADPIFRHRIVDEEVSQ